MRPKPIAIITGDVHFTLQTLDLATTVVQRAKEKALELGVPLILNGDTLDSKAIVRGEVMNRLLELVRDRKVDFIINVGNHDLISEKGSEHVLNFLRPYCTIVDSPTYIKSIDSHVIPYRNDPVNLHYLLSYITKGSRLILHQGVQTANMGHYMVDKTSLSKDCFAKYRVIASHYHKAQDIKCGEVGRNLVGLFSYIGNPYTLSFGEAEDGLKGFSILYDDGSAELVSLNLRRHRILHGVTDLLKGEVRFEDNSFPVNPDDLIWMKISGTKSQLDKLDKKWLGKIVLGHSNYKLEKVYTDKTKMEYTPQKSGNNGELFDRLIDTLDDTLEQKQYLKDTWRTLLS